MDTSTAPTVTTTNPLADTHTTLSHLVEYLREGGAGLIKTATKAELMSYEEPYVHTGVPVYKVIEVFLSNDHKAKNDPIYMVFVLNGAIHYCHGDCLSDYLLDEPEFFTEQPFNYEAIFSAFFLDGDTYLASFAGFFYLEPPKVKAA